jgi:nitrogen regulatory protein P-II 2
MQLSDIKLVTIITMDVLEEEIVSFIKQTGAKGFTTTEARGEGLSTIRNSAWEGKNIRIETLVSEEIANKIFEHLVENYFEKYKTICFLQDVKILRKEKFV